MGDDGQLGVLFILGGAFSLGIFFVLMFLARWLWAWIVGKPAQSGPDLHEDRDLEAIGSRGTTEVTASDLFVIRSNLNAVARQVEDLERRLCLSPAELTKPKVVALARK